MINDFVFVLLLFSNSHHCLFFYLDCDHTSNDLEYLLLSTAGNGWKTDTAGSRHLRLLVMTAFFFLSFLFMYWVSIYGVSIGFFIYVFFAFLSYLDVSSLLIQFASLRQLKRTNHNTAATEFLFLPVT